MRKFHDSDSMAYKFMYVLHDDVDDLLSDLQFVLKSSKVTPAEVEILTRILTKLSYLHEEIRGVEGEIAGLNPPDASPEACLGS